MGINIHGAKALCLARSAGADFDHTATIARQRLSLSRAELRRTLQSFGLAADTDSITAILEGADGYAEALLKHLGSRAVHSFDISPYENASFIHDMNEPIDEKHRQKYSVVFDSGSLEHIFNVPVAIKNCMEMVEIGGHYICILPANNFFGHGFYQFSPEFFFGVFNEDNGFFLERLIAFEDEPNWCWRSADPGAPWFEVASPEKLRERVTLVNSKPVSLIAIARRVAVKPILSKTPQQSDYAAIWRDDATKHLAQTSTTIPARPMLLKVAKRILPGGLRLAIRKALTPRPRPLGQGFEPRFFRRVR